MGVIKAWGRIAKHCSRAGHNESVELWNSKPKASEAPTTTSQKDDDEMAIPFQSNETSDEEPTVVTATTNTADTASSPTAASPTGADENWILHLGKEVGRPVHSLDDIIKTNCYCQIN